MAEAAISDMNQVEFMGRPLLHDIPRSTPDVREKILARQGNAGGHPVRKSRSALLDGMCESIDDGLETKSSSDSERNICDVLETYSNILDKMRMKRNMLRKGSHVRVMVTSAEEETFFWGQVVSETENLLSLKHLVKDIQNPDSHLARPKGLGRCAALYEGERHRAWILKASLKATEKLKVIFVDYGNIENVTGSETCVVTPRFWELPPVARPFTIQRIRDYIDNHHVISDRTGDASDLNMPNTSSEVESAVASAKCGKTAGADCLPAEALEIGPV